MIGLAAPLSLRAATPKDESLLLNLYASTRAAELARVDWDETRKADFIKMQYHAQHAHYMQHYPDGNYQIVLYKAKPVGNWYTFQSLTLMRVLDITILPQFRGRGIGRQLMTQFIAEAKASQRRIRLYVYKENPQVSTWYERLGFQAVGGLSMYTEMEWRP
ncbi:N-acetyltransferase [Herpetosiphon gulosus]|uniref:N-acetyltransferase domain-containing protein n=1 Tax=Herpetosiphon gulosus TaxID=1973496 RepID=A0ABP9WSX9_9CHLR